MTGPSSLGDIVFVFDRPDLNVGDNARRAVRAEFDQAIAEVGETGFEVHDTVRNVRRRLKRIRALLRMIRPVFKEFRAENAALRDIGGGISALRDARALVEAVDRLGRGVDPTLVSPVARWRAVLMAQAADREAGLDRDALLLELRTDLREARVRSELWELTTDGRRAIVPGLVATYRKARQGYRAAARASNDDVAFHEWRKQLKHHLGLLKLLRGLVPGFADRRRRRLAQLATLLGELQNLCVLQDHLETAPLDLDRLNDELCRQTARLRRRCLRLGKRLFADKPRKVRRRWRGYAGDWLEAEGLVRRK